MRADGHLTSLEGAELDKPLGATEVFGELLLDLGSLIRTALRFRPVAGEFESVFSRFADFLDPLG